MIIGFFLLVSKSGLGPPKAKQPGLTHREVAMVNHLIKKNVCQIDHQLYEAANTIARLRKPCRNNKKTPEGKAMAKRSDHLWEAAVDLSSLTKMCRCNPSSTSITISPIQVNDAVDRLARSQRLAAELLLVLLETGWRKSYQRRTKLMRLNRSLRRRTKSLRTSKRALVSRRASRRAKRRGNGTPGGGQPYQEHQILAPRHRGWMCDVTRNGFFKLHRGCVSIQPFPILE
jgi:hypothetical protein